MKTAVYLIFLLFSVQAVAQVRPTSTVLAEKGFFCSKGGFKNIIDTLSGIMDREDINQTLSIKSDKEVNEWIECFTSGRSYENFAASIELLKQTEESFGVPYAVMACKIWQETRWQGNQKSPEGAKGYVQIIPAQVQELHKVMSLALDQKNYPEVQKYKTLVEQDEAKYKEIAELENNQKLSAVEKTERLKALNQEKEKFEKQILKFRENPEVRNYDYGQVLVKAWPSWAAKQDLSPTLCSEPSCTKAPYDDPKWAIGVGGLNSMYLMLKLSDDYKRKGDKIGEPISYSRHEFQALMATAYNSGQNGPVKEITPVSEELQGEPRLKSFLSGLQKRSAKGRKGWNQTVCYVSNIDSCLRPKNMQPAAKENPLKAGPRCGVSDSEKGEPSKNLIECK